MAEEDLTTYQAGIMQAKAYRALKQFITTELRDHDLTMMEWAILGTVSESEEEGMRVSDLAEVLDVEISLITNMVRVLDDRGYVDRRVDPDDRRAKRIVATKDTRKMVDRVEEELRHSMVQWLGDIDRLQLAGYVKTLTSLSRK